MGWLDWIGTGTTKQDFQDLKKEQNKNHLISLKMFEWTKKKRNQERFANRIFFL